MDRRHFCGALALTPIAAMLAACGKNGDWPPGMAEIKWDRDTCVRCNMVISDYRFAAQIRGGEKNTAFRFDDIGCLAFWLRDKAQHYPWMADAATHMWVADATSKPNETLRWFDPRQARYQAGRISPMGYNFAAIPAAAAESGPTIDFAQLREQLYARGK